MHRALATNSDAPSSWALAESEAVLMELLQAKPSRPRLPGLCPRHNKDSWKESEKGPKKCCLPAPGRCKHLVYKGKRVIHFRSEFKYNGARYGKNSHR